MCMYAWFQEVEEEEEKIEVWSSRPCAACCPTCFQIAKCICPNCEIVFVQIAKLYFKVYLTRSPLSLRSLLSSSASWRRKPSLGRTSRCFRTCDIITMRVIMISNLGHDWTNTRHKLIDLSKCWNWKDILKRTSWCFRTMRVMIVL